ncbi:MAG TPA: outer membrane protein transport protein [Polyangiaceae bacterium]|nr:outer membrane protein transport protein [Polyangiaceae bacterium]
MTRPARVAARAAVVLAVLGAGAAWPLDARAAGFATARFGGEHGTVVTTNPTALYFNPAGIGFSDGTHVFLDGQLAMRNATWEHTLAPSDIVPQNPAGSEGNAGRAHLFNVFGAPALGATTKLGNLALGAGLFVPFGGRASWDTNDQFASKYPLSAAGVQRWHMIDGALTFIYGTVGAAYRFGPLSVGVAGNLVLASASLEQAKNPNGSGQPDTTREGRAKLDVSGTTASFGAGAMVEAIPRRLWLAASYQSQPNMGPMTLGGTLNITGSSGGLNAKVNFTQALPDIVRLGARWRPEDYIELRLFGDFTRWSVNKTQCAAVQGYACAVYPDGSDASGGTLANYRRNWNDTFGIRAGTSVWVTRDVEVFTGTGFETGATPDSTLEPGLADADNFEFAGGARVLVGGWIYVAASYTQLLFMNRDNTGKSTLADAQVPTLQQDGGGYYTQWIGFFDLNLEKTW